MCVIFWTTQDPRYSLVIASNRDEFLARPTLPASWQSFSSSHEEGGDILSARDSTGGGTWLGVTRNGAFATLTNFTETSAPKPEGGGEFESRGRLVRDWLVEASKKGRGRGRRLEEVRAEVEGYLKGLGGKLDRWLGFNLLVGAVSEGGGTVVGYLTNRTADGRLDKRRTPDIFCPTDGEEGVVPPTGMSNSTLTQPWPKVTSGGQTFLSTLQDSDDDEQGLVEDLFSLLWTSSTPHPAQRSELRNSILIPPLPLPTTLPGEEKDWYATRTSTVILVRNDGRCTFVERDTFKIVNNQAVLINGPESSNPVNGRSGGQRAFQWTLT